MERVNLLSQEDRRATDNTGLAKVAVQCSGDTIVVNLSLVLRINICGENRHLRQAPDRYSRIDVNRTQYPCIADARFQYIPVAMQFGLSAALPRCVLGYCKGKFA